MAITVTDIGANHILAASASLSVTVPAGGVPAGSLIYVGTANVNAPAPTSTQVTDGTNTYSLLASHGSSTTNFAGVFYVANCSALSSGTSITYTPSTSGSLGMSAFFASGISTTPVDNAVTATASGTSTSVSITSGTPGVSGELFVAFASNTAGQGVAATQGTGWTTPPDASSLNGASPSVFGGNQVNSGTGTLTWSPTWGTTATNENWNAIIAGFKALAGAAAAYFPQRLLRGVGV